MKTLDQFKSTKESDENLEEGTFIVSADYKISPSGRKVRAHRFKMGGKSLSTKDKDSKKVQKDKDLKESTKDLPEDPPVMIVLKRKSIRLYPNKTKVALYYSEKLDRYFTIPYGPNVEGSFQAEEFFENEDVLEESVMDSLHNIVKEKQAKTVKFANGKTKKVDHYTASAITQVHSALNDENKKKISDMVHKSPEHFSKVADFALSKTKFNIK